LIPKAAAERKAAQRARQAAACGSKMQLACAVEIIFHK